MHLKISTFTISTETIGEINSPPLLDFENTTNFSLHLMIFVEEEKHIVKFSADLSNFTF